MGIKFEPSNSRLELTVSLREIMSPRSSACGLDGDLYCEEGM